MRDVLLGEVWESFFIEGHKVGFLRRVTAVSETPNILVSTLTIMYGRANFKHKFYFYDEAGYPAHSYLFDTNDGAPVQARFSGNKMICQVDEHVFTEDVPADARPSYGNYPLVVTMPFEKGFRLSFTQIEDTSCTVQGKTTLISQGWETVVVGGQRLQLWLVAEYTNSQSGNRYWLDENRRVRLTHWRGAASFWVATKEEALCDLPDELVKQARNLIDGEDDPDWTVDIEKWLNQNE
ncbi:MAG: hypothetical protein GY805_10130 [Chloroflexi bacterium]|nr:hypothetical protein [Chloroflexota bacterium]